MGEREVDSCARVNRRSLCVLLAKICDQLSVSVSQGGILERFRWVDMEDARRGSCGKEREKGCTAGGWFGR